VRPHHFSLTSKSSFVHKCVARAESGQFVIVASSFQKGGSKCFVFVEVLSR